MEAYFQLPFLSGSSSSQSHSQAQTYDQRVKMPPENREVRTGLPLPEVLILPRSEEPMKKRASGKQAAGIVLLAETSFATLFCRVNNRRHASHQVCLHAYISCSIRSMAEQPCSTDGSEDHWPHCTWSDCLYCTYWLLKHMLLYWSQEETMWLPNLKGWVLYLQEKISFGAW